MNLITFICFFFFTLFFILFVFRLPRKGLLAEAKIVDVDEGIINSPQLYNTIRYFYPLMTYQYQVEDKTITGRLTKQESRKFRISEYDSFGSKNSDDKFFWRKLKKDEKVEIIYEVRNIHKSRLSLESTQIYKSETKALLVISLIFLALMCLSIVYL